MTIDSNENKNNADSEFNDLIYNIDPSTVLSGIDMAPNDVVIGGPESCFTVTGLKVESTRDALIVFEACRQGVLPRITRRLNDGEKQLIGDGTVIVFDEREAGMKRWTDGKLWTPSRILGNFLTYRELVRKLPPNQQGVAEIARWTSTSGLNIGTSDTIMPESACGTNKGVFFIKENGLIKRTISLTVPDNEAEFLSRNEWRPLKVHHQHLVVYFRAETAAQLPRPEDMEELEDLRLPLRVLQIQKFRRPVRVEMFEDGSYDFHDSEETDGGEDARVAGEGSNQQSLGTVVAGTSSNTAASQNSSVVNAVYPQPLFPFQLAALVAGAGGYQQSPPTPLVLQPPVSNSCPTIATQEQAAISAEPLDNNSAGRESSYGNSSNTSIAMYSSYDLATLPTSLPFSDTHYAADLFNTSSLSLASQLFEPLGVSCNLDNTKKDTSEDGDAGKDMGH
ncbi:Global transcription regulator sge1 [Coemansia sp. RSA 986]|nr:Global transcription regulator sge1 [Coemansia sp. RSA 1843]KAJ2090227.1 Global transcription regulator sge1 [Coemansia sp. RSA 986]